MAMEEEPLFDTILHERRFLMVLGMRSLADLRSLANASSTKVLEQSLVIFKKFLPIGIERFVTPYKIQRMIDIVEAELESRNQVYP